MYVLIVKLNTTTDIFYKTISICRDCTNEKIKCTIGYITISRSSLNKLNEIVPQK